MRGFQHLSGVVGMKEGIVLRQAPGDLEKDLFHFRRSRRAAACRRQVRKALLELLNGLAEDPQRVLFQGESRAFSGSFHGRRA